MDPAKHNDSGPPTETTAPGGAAPCQTTNDTCSGTSKMTAGNSQTTEPKNKKTSARRRQTQDSTNTAEADNNSSSDKGKSSGTNNWSKTAAAKKAASESAGINMLLFRRLGKLIPLLFPGLVCLTSVLFVLLLLVCILEQYVVYHVGLISSNYYLVLGQMDWPGFVSTTIYSIGLVSAIAGVLSGKTYISNVLYISWRQVLSRALHRLYFSGINYYSISIAPHLSLDNPDQRMTQDVELLCRSLGIMVATLIVAPFKISYYTYQTYITTGWLGPTMILVFFLLSSIVNRFIMNPIVPCVVMVEKCEGDLRFKHMQIRAASESVAFHVSGAVEATKTNYALDELIRAKQRLFNKQFWLNLSQNLFDYFGSILSYLPMAVPIFSGVYSDVDAATLSSIISKNGFVCIMLISSLSGLVDLCTNVVQMAGVTHRIAQLLEALHSLDTEWDSANDKASASYSDLTRGRRSSSDDASTQPPAPPPYSPYHPNTPLLQTTQPPPYSDVHTSQQNLSGTPNDLIVLTDNTIEAGRASQLNSNTDACDHHPSYTVVSPSSTHSEQHDVGELQSDVMPQPSADSRAHDHCSQTAASTSIGDSSTAVAASDSADLSNKNVSRSEISASNTKDPVDSDISVENSAAQKSVSPYAPVITGSAFPVGFMLQNVTLTVPGSNKILVKDLNLCISRGVNLLIMGPSSCGKTSLLRALRGLWPIQEGVLAHQSYRGPKAIMFLPQKPFLTNGTLREQIVYPEHLCHNEGTNSDGGCTNVVVDGSGDRYSSTGNLDDNSGETNTTEDHAGNSGSSVTNINNPAYNRNGSNQQQPRSCARSNNLPSESTAGGERNTDDRSREYVAFSNVNKAQGTGSKGNSDSRPAQYDFNTENIDDAKIVGLLGEMNMPSLLQRCGGLDNDPGWVWSDVLSPGEVQRLCFLRVLYHRPHFAILDEATSALSSDVEEKLYRLAAAAGVTVISVGHRCTLRAFHHSLLTLSGGGCWKIEPLV